MASTYEYATGKITLDFHLVESGSKCRLSGLPAYVDNDRCRKCSHYGGVIYGWSFRTAFSNNTKDYVKCKHPEAKDSEGCEAAYQSYCKRLKYEALCALDG